jgi:hypothetical protein
MAGYSYDTLVTDIIANMEEDSAEFVSVIPGIIERAQGYLQRRIDPLEIIYYADISVSASARTLALPSDLRILRSIEVCVSGGWRQLYQQTGEYLTVYWPDFALVSEPKYYAAKNNAEILLAPTPVSNTTAHIEYIAKVTLLTSVEQTNWFSENTGEAFFAACMMYANLWTKNKEASAIWKGIADEELTVINNEAKRTRRSDAVDRSGGAPENTISGEP